MKPPPNKAAVQIGVLLAWMLFSSFAHAAYEVTVGVFANPENAAHVVSRIKASGLPVNHARIDSARNPNTTRVWLGPYETRSQAERAQQDLIANQWPEPTLIRVVGRPGPEHDAESGTSPRGEVAAQPSSINELFVPEPLPGGETAERGVAAADPASMNDLFATDEPAQLPEAQESAAGVGDADQAASAEAIVAADEPATMDELFAPGPAEKADGASEKDSPITRSPEPDSVGELFGTVNSPGFAVDACGERIFPKRVRVHLRGTGAFF